MTFSCTYDPADDKLRLTASSRLDPELYQRARKVGFRWAPKQELFFVVWNPAAEDLALELAGEIDDEDSSLVEPANNTQRPASRVRALKAGLTKVPR